MREEIAIGQALSQLKTKKFNTQREYQRNKATLLTELLRDPENLAATAYSISDRKYISPYKSLYQPELCCLINAIPEKGEIEEVKTVICNEEKVRVLKDDITKEIKNPYILEFANRENFLSFLSMRIYRLPSTTVFPLVRFTESPPSDINRMISSELEKLKSRACIFPDIENFEKYEFLGSDEFTNATIIYYILESILGRRDMYTLQKSLISTICSRNGTNYGVNFLEYPNMNSLSMLSRSPGMRIFKRVQEVETDIGEGPKINEILQVQEDTIESIFLQGITTLHLLQKNSNFVHGKLDGDAVVFSAEEVDYEYEGISVKGSVSMKLTNFVNSSITVSRKDRDKKIRLYNRSRVSDVFFTLRSFRPKIEKQYNGLYYLVDDVFNTTIFAKQRHMGIPYYLSFDTYTFIVALLMQPDIFYGVFRDSKLKRMIWSKLFFPEDVSTAYTRIHRAVLDRTPNTIENILAILRGLKLKCMLTNNIVMKLKEN